MKIVVLFALILSTLPAFAEARPNCLDILTIPIDLGAEPGSFKPYDLVRKDLASSKILGHLINVEYRDAGKVETVPQFPFNWTQFAQYYPQFVKYGAQVLGKHNQMMRHPSVRARMAISAATSLWNPGHRELRRQMPGETGIIGALIGPHEFSTDVLFSVYGEGQATNNPEEMLRTLEMSSHKMIEDLQKTPRLVSGNRIDVLLFHTHPAGAIPLSPADREVMIATAGDFRKAFPDASVRVTMVAAAKNQQQGDLLFVSEYRSEP